MPARFGPYLFYAVLELLTLDAATYLYLKKLQEEKIFFCSRDHPQRLRETCRESRKWQNALNYTVWRNLKGVRRCDDGESEHIAGGVVVRMWAHSSFLPSLQASDDSGDSDDFR